MSLPANSVVSEHPTILLFGPTGSGKTAQIGELAEYYYKTQKKRTRLYSADRGGWETIKAHVKLGIIEAIPMFGEVWGWIDHAVKGDKLNAKNEWVPGTDPDIALYAFEGMTSFADGAMTWMADASGRGVNIGGGGSFNFSVGSATTKDIKKIGSNNQAHYGVAQQQVFDKSTQSQFLPGTVLWTAGDAGGTDDVVGGVIGPQIAGKAKTGEAPRWFKYTFRIAHEIQPGMTAKHVLYTDRHSELAGTGIAQGIANARVPLSGGADQGGLDIPSKIEPASLVQVLQMIESRQVAAEIAIRKRLGL